MVTDQEIKQFEAFIRKLPLKHRRSSKEFGYSNPALVCIDAVLSMNRKYEAFVVPRITTFKETYPEITTLRELVDRIEALGSQGFCEVWNYNHIERVVILKNLCERLMQITQDRNDSEIAALQAWASTVSPQDYRQFNVKGIGLATFQYIRMLLGVPTIKPDVHIRRAVFLILGAEKSNLDSIELLEMASNNLDLDPTLVDHNIWKLFSTEDAETIQAIIA